jgi:hypothetical protein
MTDSAWVKQLGMPAVAGSLAACFTHPLELTKIRLQLDNELAQVKIFKSFSILSHICFSWPLLNLNLDLFPSFLTKRGTPRKYSGWVDCVLKNWRSSGVRGLQGGLSLGVTREFFFSGIRIGLFEPLVGLVHAASGRDPNASAQGDEKLVAGLAAGALGGLCINPIDVLKTRAQALGGETGHQHSSLALRSMVTEEGFRGLSRGLATNTLRGLMGPGSQVGNGMKRGCSISIRKRGLVYYRLGRGEWQACVCLFVCLFFHRNFAITLPLLSHTYIHTPPS